MFANVVRTDQCSSAKDRLVLHKSHSLRSISSYILLQREIKKNVNIDIKVNGISNLVSKWVLKQIVNKSSDETKHLL